MHHVSLHTREFLDLIAGTAVTVVIIHFKMKTLHSQMHCTITVPICVLE